MSGCLSTRRPPPASPRRSTWLPGGAGQPWGPGAGREPALTADCSASLCWVSPVAAFASCSSFPIVTLGTQEEGVFILTLPKFLCRSNTASLGKEITTG